MKFIDEATIFIKAGDGAQGCVSFIRTRSRPKGGPDGGDGGDGGSIVFKASSSKNTLIDFKFQKKYLTQNGYPGGDSNKTGANGEDLIINVPAGTVVKNKATGKILADLDCQGKGLIVLKGGKGGKGNSQFCTPSRQSPNFAQPGEKVGGIWVTVELKLLADVGIVGLPNAGKSTLISRISAAKPKVADYPFTTRIPNLGVVKYDDVDFVVADVPGLILGAHAGTGLGTKFLKHIERTKALIHLVDVSIEVGNPVKNIEIINNELKLFSKDLLKKQMLYVLNKIDSAPQDTVESVKEYLTGKGHEPVAISAVTGEGLDILLQKTVDILRSCNVW